MTRTTSLPHALRRPARTAGPRRAMALAAVAVAAALALAGCADASVPGADATSASPSATPSTTPAESATPPAETGTTTIATPVDGATVTGPQVSVTGAGTAFEGTLRWRVVTAGTDDVVTEDFTTGGANGTVGPFAFTVELVPGSYTLEVWEPAISDGEGEGADAPRGLATTTFTVS